MFASIFGKPWYRSLTAWGTFGLGVVQLAETSGLIAEGTSVLSQHAVAGAQGVADQLASLASQAAALVTVLGLRKAAN